MLIKGAPTLRQIHSVAFWDIHDMLYCHFDLALAEKATYSKSVFDENRIHNRKEYG